MQLSGLDRFFWAAGFIAHITLLAVLLVRRRVARFPFFTALICWSALQTPALYLIFQFSGRFEYFVAFWTFALLGQTLEFLVVYEVASIVFRPLGSWAPDIKGSSLALTIASIIVATALTWLASPPTHFWEETLVIKATLFSAALMSQLFVGMIVISVTVGLPWRTHVAQIAWALGSYSIAEILIYAAQNVWGLSHDARVYSLLSQTRIGLYLCCLLYWIFALWQDAPVAQVLTAQNWERIESLQARVGTGLGNLRSRRE